MFGWSQGVRHILARGHSVSLCGLPARLPAPDRPAPPCCWCLIAQRARHKSDGGRVTADRFNGAGMLRPVERKAVERF